MELRRQRATAVGLAVVGLFVSLTTHVVGRHLAGNRVRITNYRHFFAESAGLLIGMAYILLQRVKEGSRIRSNGAGQD